MKPIQLTIDLAEPVRRILADVQTKLIQRDPFDPMTSERSFSIATPDYSTRIFFAKIAEQLQKDAPKMRLDVWPLTGIRTIEKFSAGEIDLIISLEQYLQPNLPQCPLYSEDFVAIAWEGNDEIGETLSLKDYERLGHVVVRLGAYRMTPIDEIFISDVGVKRRAEIVVGAFDHTPEFILKTKRLATVQRRLARHFAATMPLRIFELPFDAPQQHNSMRWHRHNTPDAAHSWLRNSICDFINGLPKF